MAKVQVRYKGLSDERIITQKDLKDRNIKVDRDLVLNSRNGWQQVIDATDDLVKLLRDQVGFTVSEVKDDGSVGGDIITAEQVDDTADSTIHDTTTGQVSKKR